MTKNNFKQILKNSFALFFVLAAAFAVSYYLYVWYDYPRGNDAVSHLYKIKFVADFFPHINWNHAWAGGMPMFSLYPFLPYMGLASLFKISGLSLETVLAGTTVFWGVGFGAFGVYLIVNRATKSFFPSLFASLVYLTTPGVWSVSSSGGLYARALAYPFLIMTIWAVVSYWMRENEGLSTRRHFLLGALFLGLTMLFHYSVGVIAAGSVFLASIFLSKRILKAFLYFLKTLILGFMIAAPLMVPFLIKGASTQNLIESELMKRIGLLIVPLNRMFTTIDFDKTLIAENKFLNPSHWTRLNPFLLGFMAVLLIPLVTLKLKRKIEDFHFRVLAFFYFISLCLFIYGVVLTKLFIVFYYSVGGPEVSVSYIPIFAASAVGISIAAGIKNDIYKHLISVFLIFSVISWFLFQYAYIWKSDKFPHLKERNYEHLIYQFNYQIIPNPKQFNFRLGDGDDNGTLASWLNIEFPYTPQTRDYFFQGVVDKDYYSQKDFVLWHQSDNYYETDYMLDWWGINQFLVSLAGKVKGKYNDKGMYALIGDGRGLWGADAYRYKEATAILSATNSSTVLVVGTRETYDLVFRALGRGNINSRTIIPVNFGNFSAGYDLTALKQFDSIFLYGYDFDDEAKSLSSLLDYVKEGGRLIIESQEYYETSGELPDPFPVTRVARGEAKNGWSFDTSSNFSLGKELLDSFGPPVYDNGPWGISYAKSIKNWAYPVISDNDKPIIVEGRLGEGSVVWSGLNLPFHANSFNNPDEARFLADLILGRNLEREEEPPKSVWSDEDLLKEPAFRVNLKEQEKLITSHDLIFEGEYSRVQFVNPEKRLLTLKKPAKGVLFKEFFVPNWKAYLVGDGKTKNLKIYKAGPNFMYVPLEGAGQGHEVVLVYKRLWWENLSIIVSFTALVGILSYYFDWWIFKPVVTSVRNKLMSPFRTVSRWWRSDEE